MSFSPANAAPAAANRLSAFRNSNQGSLTIILSLCLPVLMGVLGSATDFGAAIHTRDELMMSADSASLSAIAKNSPGMLAAAAMTTDGEVPSAQRDAIAFFDDEISRSGLRNLTEAHASVIKTGSTVTSTITFSTKVRTHFLGLFGYNTLTVDGHATSISGTPPYINFYLMLDNSPSMGIAATPSDVDTMVSNTRGQGGCAFACHETDKAGHDNYTLAKNLGVTTRIDVLRQATQKLMDTATSIASVPDQFGMSVNTFNVDMTNVVPLTTDLSSAKSQAEAVDLMVVPNQGWNDDRDTDFDVSMGQLAAVVPKSGSGITSADPQSVVFLVTDGVEDTNSATVTDVVSDAHSFPDSSRLIQAFNPALCSSMKAKGIKVAVIYTTYVALPTNYYYNKNVAPWQDEINPNIKACATPGYFFEVSPTQGISDAMDALFRKAVAEARISS